MLKNEGKPGENKCRRSACRRRVSVPEFSTQRILHFYANGKVLGPHSQYMRDARAAATGKHLTRVFIVDKASDLKSKLREQILLILLRVFIFTFVNTRILKIR